MDKSKKTDWNTVAPWYDQYLESSGDTYQEQVIAPNLLRMLGVHKGSRVLDVACGQGYFARLCAKHEALITGIDQSSDLIALAKSRAGKNETYILGNAEKLPELKLKKFDLAYTVLAFENMRRITDVLTGIASVLDTRGRFILVLLHPAFRIPQYCDWGYDMKKGIQYRKVEKYLSEITIPITLSPFKSMPAVKKKITTHTFHRPLQWYMKAFKTAGFAVIGMEEWISHKRSQAGPRQAAEDAARKEFPMFLALELRKL